MLTHTNNEMLTRTGPGTPMGQFMRAHWFPFMLSEELVPDAPPRRIALLGEKLVAFRDSEGRVGLVAELCPHRRASLYYGRNEEGGLRCVYHGWKFDVEGRCVDMPSQPLGCPLQTKVRLEAYPCVEHAGLVWTCMSAHRLDAAPASLPELPWTTVPGDHRYTSRWLQDCNWAQALEGEIDEAHVGFLHARWPAFVLTHRVPAGWPRPNSTVSFVTDGIESAVKQARAAAAGKSVGVHGADTIQQLLNAGLLDEIHVDIAALLLGSGVRLFEHFAGTPVVLGNPAVIAGVGVTHLRYPVHKT